VRTTKEELTVASLTTSGVEADALNYGTVPIAEMAVCELPPLDRTLAVAYTEHLGHR
jgi:hypothetical protein